MDTIDTNTNIVQKYAYVIIVVAVILWIIVLYAYQSSGSSSQKPSIEDRIKQVNDLRATKKVKQEQITKLEEEIYILDQKIIAWKCSNYSEVGAKDTWQVECAEFYDAQQSKIDESTDNSWSDE